MKQFKQMLFWIGIAVSLSTHAQPNFEKQFSRLDQNQNAEIAWDEAYPIRAAEFTKLDKNFNGVIEQNEFRDRMLPFSKFDANMDGKLEFSEYIGQHYAMFKKADTDRNSNINLQEFSRIQQSIREKNTQP